MLNMSNLTQFWTRNPLETSFSHYFQMLTHFLAPFWTIMWQKRNISLKSVGNDSKMPDMSTLSQFWTRNPLETSFLHFFHVLTHFLATFWTKKWQKTINSLKSLRNDSKMLNLSTLSHFWARNPSKRHFLIIFEF